MVTYRYGIILLIISVRSFHKLSNLSILQSSKTHEASIKKAQNKLVKLPILQLLINHQNGQRLPGQIIKCKSYYYDIVSSNKQNAIFYKFRKGFFFCK